jgi:hypothetical protein
MCALVCIAYQDIRLVCVHGIQLLFAVAENALF